MAELFKFPMGATVKDRLTGLKGVIEARSDWLNGCVQYLVNPQTVHEGKAISGAWVDEDRLELAGKKIFVANSGEPVGGPMPAPSSPVSRP